LLAYFNNSNGTTTISNGTLVSGTDLQIGAVYRFNDVKPGVNCFVTIADIGAGITVSELDGSSGYPQAASLLLLRNP
jgi:hypothetical protein